MRLISRMLAAIAVAASAVTLVTSANAAVSAPPSGPDAQPGMAAQAAANRPNAAPPPATDAVPALANGLGKTPPLGWNDWYAFHCNLTAALVEQTADTMVSSGMKAAGYQYVNLDDCWLAKTRTADGSLQADPAKFPDGIAAVANYVHARGLKLGIYEDVGTKTCAGYPGSYGHVQQDADSFASWGVDFVKVDWCNVPFADFPGLTKQQVAKKLYTAYSAALLASGRQMFFSICEWDPSLKPWTWAPKISNMWRSNNDYSDSWDAVLHNLDGEANNGSFAGPGAWNDPDILQVGLGGMTTAEDQAHMSMWAVLAAPLLAGNDLRSMSSATKAILTNKDVIAVDQDRLGVQGRRIARRGDADVWSKPLANGDRAVLLLNRGAGDLTVQTTAAQVGLPSAKSYAVRDLWSHSATQSGGTIVAGVPAHSAVLVRVGVKRTPSASAAPTAALSLAVPALPGVSQPIVTAGTAGRLTSTFTNGGPNAVRDVRVITTAPDGWSITPAAPASAASVKPGAQLVSRWRLTPPSDVPAGSYPVIADVSYRFGPGAKKLGYTKASLLVTVPQLPPAGKSWLSDLPWLSAINGYGPPVLDKNYQGKPLTIRGTVYPKGLWTNANAALTYYIGGRCSAFTSVVGIDDITAGKGSVDYQLFADGTKVYDSGTVTGSSPAATATADLTGVKVLRLVVTDAGDGISYDNADWGGAALTC